MKRKWAGPGCYRCTAARPRSRLPHVGLWANTPTHPAPAPQPSAYSYKGTLCLQYSGLQLAMACLWLAAKLLQLSTPPPLEGWWSCEGLLDQRQLLGTTVQAAVPVPAAAAPAAPDLAADAAPRPCPNTDIVSQLLAVYSPSATEVVAGRLGLLTRPTALSGTAWATYLLPMPPYTLRACVIHVPATSRCR